ncbi:ABC transporter substrate-binding protein, partial [Halomonas desiderata]|nr:ABC transporter substrate-binding protein [Halomonas desiderata]
MKKMTKFALTGLAAGVALAALSTTAQAQERWTMTSTWPDSIDLIQIDRHWVELV